QDRQEKLFRAIGYVGDDLIQRADAPAQAERKQPAVWIKWAALAACCALVIGLAARLPIFQAKSSAPEMAPMTIETTTQEAPAEEEKAEAPDMTEEAAAEAPAEAEDNTAGARAPSADGAETQDAISAKQALLLDTTLGPVKLGMPLEDVRSILGAPKEDRGEFYVCTDKGDYRYATWAYNLSNDPDYICDVLLRFADVGDGLVLDEIMTFGTSDWALPTGIRNGSSADDVLAAYPDAQVQYNGPDGALSAVVFEAGHVHLHIMVENGGVTNITLGTYYEAPGWVDETPAEEPAYSFASSDMIVYQKEEDGWLSYHMKGQTAKKLEVILGIEDLTPMDELVQARYYIDFQNGTVVMLGDDRLSGAVYTCDDPDGLRAAMDEGADPMPYLTLVQMCAFPAGTDEVVLEMSVACGGLIE
ncbi:MAG: hypothetical protein SOV41_00020, partial [Oscillospiraceae bacterium]|nr:hypothetical protein [Oscillospiraceae bacterium]